MLNIFFYKKEYIFYKSDFDFQNELSISQVEEFGAIEDIPITIKKQLQNKISWFSPLFQRLKKGKAKLLCITSNDRLLAYGWLQDWSYFKNKFSVVAKEGIMMGPYWTDETERGKGYYKLLLSHSLYIVKKTNKSGYIFTSPENIFSKRGIENLKFKYISHIKLLHILRFYTKLISKEF